MIPLSGLPNQLTVITYGKVRTNENPMTSHAARNFPITASAIEIGIVNRSSTVPLFSSSDHNRIAIGGTRIRYSHGWNAKKEFDKVASFVFRKSPNGGAAKVKKPASNKKIIINI